jgi:hypothetical protein
MARKAPLTRRPKGNRNPTDTAESAKLGMSIVADDENEAEDNPEPGTPAFGARAKKRRRNLLGMKKGETDPALVDTLRKTLRRA